MAVNWSEFDKNVNLDGLKKDIKEAAANSTMEYQDIPPGTYEVAIKNLELGETKENPRPMVKGQFQILDGNFKNSYIFYNQLVTEGWQIKQVNEFLASLNTSIDVDFHSYHEYAEMLLDIVEEIDGSMEYLIDYDQTKKGFPTFDIKEVFEIE